MGKQIFVVRASPVSTSTVYTGIYGANGSNSFGTTEDWVLQIVPVAGTFRNLRIDNTTEAGSGNSREFRLWVNGATTALVASGASTPLTDTSNEVTVSPGDRVSIKYTPTGTPASSTPSFSIEFEPDLPYKNVLMSGSSTSLSTSARSYGSVVAGRGFFTGSPDGSELVIPTYTKVEAIYFRVPVAPGVGKNYTISLYKNGSEVSGTTFTISDTSTTGNITGLSVPLVPGDRIALSALPSGTPTSSNGWNAGILLHSNIDGESIFGGGTSSSPSNAQFNQFIGMGQSWGSTESPSNEATSGPTTWTAQDFRIWLQTAPGAGKSRTFTVRKNRSNSALAVTIANTDTEGVDTSSPNFTSNDEISLRHTQSGSPASIGAMSWAVTQFTNSGAINPDTKANSVKAFIKASTPQANSVKAHILIPTTSQDNSVKANIITTYYTGATYDWKLSTADDNNVNRGYQP